MFPSLQCTVRGCGARLERVGRTLRCARGHAFDVARAGYCNLLGPQDRRSTAPGDSDDAVAARGRWLERGFANRVAADAATLLDGLEIGSGASVVDVGCGEGSLTQRLCAARGWNVCGIDLSTAALRRAAARWPEATWIAANADRRLPLLDASVDLALSLYGRRHGPELRRVLRPTGRLVVALPAEDDLIELREALLGRAAREDRVGPALEALGPDFALVERRISRARVLLDEPAVQDALAATYRRGRPVREQRAARLGALEVTVAAELLVLGPRGSDVT